MGYDDWLFRQVDKYYGNDDCTYDEDDEDSWCECNACKNRRKYEYDIEEADAAISRMKEEHDFDFIHAFELINGYPR